MNRAFYLTFGFLAVFIGFGIAAWIAYNLFIERQPEYRGGALFMPVTMIGCGVYWLRKGVKPGAKQEVVRNIERRESSFDK